MAIPVAIEIKDQLIRRIQTLSSVQKVYPSAVINDEGWPAVSVTPATEVGEFSSNAENSRVYNYDCVVLFPMGQDFVPESERNRMDYAERVIAQVTEDIINTIDTHYELERGAVLFVNAGDIEWAYYQYEGGVARAANVTLAVYTELVVV